MLKGLLFFQLLYVVNQLHFPLETGIPAVAPANLVFLAVLVLMRGRPETLRTSSILKHPMLYFFAALSFAFLWAQLRASANLVADLTYLKNALFYPLFYFIYLRCRQDERTTRQLVIWVMVIAAVAGLEAFREGLDYGFDRFNPTRRASGPFGMNFTAANRAGVFFAMFLPMFVALALFLRRQRLWRIAALAGSGILAAGTLVTYSRQSYFMALLSTALLLLRKNILLAIVVGVALVSLSEYLPESVFQRVEETKQTGEHGEEEVDVSTASRWEIWQGAMHMLASNPMGVGLNRFKGEIGKFSRHKQTDAHNFYVLTLAECGPPGLVTLLMLVWALFRLAGHLRALAPAGDTEAIGLTVGFTVTTVCVALGNFYGSPFLEGPVMAPYWALAGLLERYVALKRQGASQDGDQPREPSLVERFPLAAYRRRGRRP